MQMKKMISAAAAALALFMLIASGASAHVVVYPQSTTSGTYEKFTVRVPTEKDIPTVKVRLAIPEGVNITRFMPVPGWSYTLERDATGKIVSVEWTAENGGLSSTEFGEFAMTGRVADDATELVWKAYQTYSDGSVVEWTGAPGSDQPASVTAVIKGTGNSDHHGAAPASASPASSAPQDGQESSVVSQLTLYLSIVALLLSIVAMVLALRRRG
jgi:uncharacterized protein YcnI